MNALSKQSEITVLFVGDGLLAESGVPELFCSLSKMNHRTIHLHQKNKAGYRLSQHVEELAGADWNELRETADVVILQEYSGEVGEDTYSAITEICGLFSPDTRFFSLITELDYPKELKAIDNHRYIYSGYAHHVLVEGNILAYEQLHQQESMVPNELYRYLIVCVLYGTLFSVKCEMLSDEFIAPEHIPGETDRLKRETMRRIKRAADMACEFSREHAAMLKP